MHPPYLASDTEVLVYRETFRLAAATPTIEGRGEFLEDGGRIEMRRTGVLLLRGRIGRFTVFYSFFFFF